MTRSRARVEPEVENEEWRQIKDFPDYSISNTGMVRNDRTGRIMARTLNQQGIVQVGFSHNGDYYKRSVALLVAHAFIPRPMGPFDTPINLDGDRTNNCVENLMWRPRWFAIMYHKQFRTPERYRVSKPIIDVKNKEIFVNSFDCCTKFGLLARDLFLSINNNTVVWPTYQQFQTLD